MLVKRIHRWWFSLSHKSRSCSPELIWPVSHVDSCLRYVRTWNLKHHSLKELETCAEPVIRTRDDWNRGNQNEIISIVKHNKKNAQNEINRPVNRGHWGTTHQSHMKVLHRLWVLCYLTKYRRNLLVTQQGACVLF